MYHSQDTLNRAIHVDISLLCPIIQLEILIDQAGHLPVTHSIQLGHCQDISQGIIVCVSIKGQSVKVFVEFLDHSPLVGEKHQYVGRGSEIQPW